jgi:hypothetical protein
MADPWNRESYDTPKRSCVRGAIEYMEARGIPHSKEDVFRFNQVSYRQGWAMISEGSIDRRHHGSDGTERRGRPWLITNNQLKEMDRLIKEEGFEARQLSWLELGHEVGIEGVSSRSISKAMGETMDYSRCIACQKQWVNKGTAIHRKEWSKIALHRRPTPEDWHDVRFSDEVHWGFGPKGSIYIIRKPGERYCSDCI